MLRRGDGTGRSLPNAACDAATYNGGLQCCHHTYLLTDREQEKLIRREAVDTYFLKWRYYFQEYVPPTAPMRGPGLAALAELPPTAEADRLKQTKAFDFVGDLMR